MIRLVFIVFAVALVAILWISITNPLPNGPSAVQTGTPTPAHTHHHRKPAQGTHAAGNTGQAPPSGGTCRLRGAGAMTAPARHCTPGAIDPNLPLTVAQVCQHRDRVAISESERHAIEAAYGYTSGTFHGELDHRVPHFLNGADDPRNLWPEPGSIPNPKDRLEDAVRSMVCSVPPTMTPAAAVRLFRGDWRSAFRRYVPR